MSLRPPRFFTRYPDQRRIRLDIDQGENYYAADNLRLGELTVTGGKASWKKTFVCRRGCILCSVQAFWIETETNNPRI